LLGGPGTSVKDVLLQERKEGFHGGVVTRGAYSSHGTGQTVPAQGVDELPRAELPRFN
jgi:hypothetical protein